MVVIDVLPPRETTRRRWQAWCALKAAPDRRLAIRKLLGGAR